MLSHVPTCFGLICPACRAGYPLGNENKRDWRYSIADLRFALTGQWELTCIRCGTISRFDNFQSWQPSQSYTAAQMAVAGLRVKRVRGIAKT